MDKFINQLTEVVGACKNARQERLLSPKEFLQLTADEVDRAGRYDRPLAIAMIVIDGLTMFRQAEGKARTEEVADGIIAHLIELLRGPDRTARLGISEVGVLMPETTLRNAAAVAERMRSGIHSDNQEVVGAEHKLGLSIGVAAVSARMRDPKRFLMTACFELRRAQSKGGNIVSVASADLVRMSAPRSGQIH